MASAERKSKKSYTTQDYKDFFHTGPGTLAGRFIRSFWQPVYRAKDLLPSQAKPIRIMSEDFTLYRGESGTPHLVAPRCAHRRTQLSAGWVEGDCIRCMYHGWKYDGSGQCVEQPAEDESFAKKIRIRSYPTREYLGLIYAYLGEGEAPPFPRYKRFEEEGLLWVLPTFSWPCNYFQILENHPDTCHITFTHGNTFETANKRGGIPTINSMEETDWGISEWTNFPSGAKQIYQFGMPNVHDMRLPSPNPEIAWYDLIRWTVPVDDGHSLILSIRLWPAVRETARQLQEDLAKSESKWDSAVRELGESVLSGKVGFQDMKDAAKDENKLIINQAQDYVGKVGQGPVADRENEHLGRSDVGVILLRKIWERELRALAEGRPLKKWFRPEGMVPFHSDFENRNVKMSPLSATPNL